MDDLDIKENKKKKIFAKYTEHFDSVMSGEYRDEDFCICDEEECTCKDLPEELSDEVLK